MADEKSEGIEHWRSKAPEQDTVSMLQNMRGNLIVDGFVQGTQLHLWLTQANYNAHCVQHMEFIWKPCQKVNMMCISLYLLEVSNQMLMADNVNKVIPGTDIMNINGFVVDLIENVLRVGPKRR